VADRKKWKDIVRQAAVVPMEDVCTFDAVYFRNDRGGKGGGVNQVGLLAEPRLIPSEILRVFR